MAGSFNRITLVGNLTRDPEIRYVGSGAAVTKFTLAVNRRSKQQEETDYIDCVAWDKLAETCNTYLKKGMSCLVDGRLSIRSYETKEGEKRKASEVVVNTMQMLDRANRAGGDGGSYERPRAAAAAPNGNGSGGYDDALDEEEIPF
ncbi:MAG TPA: single-stranded DNA-binding protein [Candidatus Elarobacter sp.]|jgi:single-strand DNA-binding protein|nr:single-stranded DNA-binding protein [Candidatus Elarobacter sp.]